MSDTIINTKTIAVALAPPLPDEPYRGIEPFRFIDHQIFTARQEETWELLSNITLYRAVLLYGASGTGKSSLINAGLLPLVVKENYVPVRLRVQPIAGREIKVEPIRISGDEQQATYLPSIFAQSESDGLSESTELSLAAFRARLEDFRPQRTDKAERAPATPRPLLIFDQFEEFITLFEEARRVGPTGDGKMAVEQVPAAQQDILATLVELIQDETLPIKIIFAFREDYLAKLSLLFDHCPDLLDQAQRLMPPSIQVLPQIIRAPFTKPELREHFLKQRGGTGSELSESLAQRIAEELGSRSEHGNANLTELQIVCQRLWQAPNPEELFAKEGIEGLLKDYSADVFRNLSPELRNAAVVLLSHLITASNTRNIISEEDLLSRTAECDLETSNCSAALAALARSQMVRREPRHNIYFYEITSEYLVPWIKERVAERKSDEERRKVEEERAQAVERFVAERQRFEVERRRSRVFQRVLMAMIVLMIITGVLAYFAYRQYQHAKVAEAKATKAQQQTDEILKALTLLTSQNPDDNLGGIAQFDKLVKDNKIPADLASVVIQPVLASQNKSVHQAGYDFLLRVEQTNPNVAQSVVKAAQTNDALAEKIPPRFYIHIADESQRAQAQRLAAFLKSKGYLVPGIANVGEKGVRNNQLRYFRDSEPGIPTPQEIVALLNSANMGNWIVNRVRGYEQSQKVVVGQFELWFASPAPPPQQADANAVLSTLLIYVLNEDKSEIVGERPVVRVRSLSDNSTVSAATDARSFVVFTLKPGSYEVIVSSNGYYSDKQRVSNLNGSASLAVMLRKKYSGPPSRVTPD